MEHTVTGTLHVKKGRFYAVLNLKDVDGKRKQKWISLGLQERNNKRAAEKKLKEIIAEYEGKKVVYDNTMLFSELLETWLEISKLRVRMSTYQNYKLSMEAHAIPYFRTMRLKLKDLKPRHLDEYYLLKSETLSVTTLKKHHSNIHSALEYARKNHIVSENVADNIQFSMRKQKSLTTPGVYTPDLIHKLVAAVNGDIIETPIRLICQYGLRRGEALGLKWDRVDLKKKTIFIGGSFIIQDGTGTYVDATKSEDSKRWLPIPDSMAEYLKTVKQEQETQKELLGSQYSDGGFVCAKKDGSPICPTYVSQRFKKTLAKNGLPPIRLHDLRHSAATNLLSGGFSLKEVSELLGHADISTTANIYGHVLEDTKRKMVEAYNILN